MKKTVPLIRDLESRIICGVYGPGQKIPSLRKLMERYGVSMNTAKRAVDALAAKGLLSFRHGSGIFVAESRRPTDERYRIALVAATFGLNLTNTYTGLAAAGLMDSADELGIEVVPILKYLEEMSDTYLEELSAGFDGVILMGGYDEVLKQPRAGCPVVGLSMQNSCGGTFSLLELDPFRATELAVDFFRSRKIRKVTVMTHDRPVHRFREQLFKEEWKKIGESVSMPETDSPVPHSTNGIYYLCGSTALNAALAFRERTGKELAQCCPVLCVDGQPMFSNHPCPDLPTIAINLHLAGVAAAEECLRRITRPGSAARRIYINAELYIGTDS